MNHSQKSPTAARNLLARIHSLSRRDARDREKLFWLEGIRNFIQACDAKLDFHTVIYSPVLLQVPLAEMLVRCLAASGVSRIRVSPEEFRSISTAQRASGIGAIVRQRWTPLENANPSRGLCWLVIEHIRSPGNLGTILRTAEAVGVGGIIFLSPQCDPFDQAVIRASMGGIFHLQLIRATHEQLAHWVDVHKVQFVGLSPRATKLWTQMPDSGPIGLMLGEERTGLSAATKALCRTSVRLPMTGHADSLNVSIATGIALYELVRRNQ